MAVTSGAPSGTAPGLPSGVSKEQLAVFAAQAPSMLPQPSILVSLSYTRIAQTAHACLTTVKYVVMLPGHAPCRQFLDTSYAGLLCRKWMAQSFTCLVVGIPRGMVFVQTSAAQPVCRAWVQA